MAGITRAGRRGHLPSLGAAAVCGGVRENAISCRAGSDEGSVCE